MRISYGSSKPTIRSQLGARRPGTQKLNTEIVALAKGWLGDGVGVDEVLDRVKASGFVVKKASIEDIQKGRTWATTAPKNAIGR